MRYMQYQRINDIDRGSERTILGEPKYLRQGLMLVPGCHDEAIVWNLPIVERLEIREIDGGVPARALLTPGQHVDAPGVDEPLAR